MFHYAVDVIGGLLLGVLAVLTFDWVEYYSLNCSVCSLNEANSEGDARSAKR
jgi:membrane-associated phospholipid phosphatase